MKKTLILVFVTLFIVSSIWAISGSTSDNIITISNDSDTINKTLNARANRDILYDQTANSSTNSASSQDFEAGYEIYDNQAVDDFLVPVGETWEIANVQVLGSLSNLPMDLVNVYFYDNTGICNLGAIAYSYVGISCTDNGTGNLNIDLPTIASFSEGTYWLSVQCANGFASNGQWYWNLQTVQTGCEAMWQNPGDGFGTGFTTWTGVNTAYPPDYDFSFILSSIATEPIFSVTPDIYDFGSIPIGYTPTQIFTLSNIGTGTITIANLSDITLSATGDPEFSLGTITSVPGTLPSDVITIEVQYAPTAVASHATVLSIVWTGSGRRDQTDIDITGSGCTPVANDDCVNAELITGSTGSGSTECAYVDCPGYLDWNGIWYEIPLPYALNDVEITMCNDIEDITNIGIVLMDDCACDDFIVRDGGIGWITCASTFQGYNMIFSSVPQGTGTILWPASVEGANGGIPFTWEVNVTEVIPDPPANDLFCDAQAIVVDDAPITGDNTDSTVETWEVMGSCWYTDISNTVWYSFVAPSTGNVMISTDFITGNDDTQLALYEWTGGDCSNPTLVELGCNDDISGTNYMSLINASGLTVGATYYVQVDGWDTTIGEFMIEVTAQAPSNPLDIAIVTDGTNVTITWDAVTGATGYKVFSSTDPYTGFVEDITGTLAAEQWVAPSPLVNTFYYVTATN